MILLIILLPLSFILKAKKNNDNKSNNNLKIKVISTKKDEPVDFAFKIWWIAVKTNDKNEIAKILELKDIQACNWESGIENAYDDMVFITPQIGEWTIAVGRGLLPGDSKESIEKLEIILNKLSSKFGEAQFFGSHRIVDFYNWMKSTNGKIDRIYSYSGYYGENIKIYGEPTEVEKNLKLYNSFLEEANTDEYLEQEDLVYPGEDLFLEIAESWSINPSKLSERDDIKDELGIIGK